MTTDTISTLQSSDKELTEIVNISFWYENDFDDNVSPFILTDNIFSFASCKVKSLSINKIVIVFPGDRIPVFILSVFSLSLNIYL